MNVYSRILKVLSIISVVLATILIISALGYLIYGVYGLATGQITISDYSADVTDLLENGMSEFDAINLFIVGTGVALALGGLFWLVLGLLGLRASRNPKKIKLFIVLISLLCAFSFVSNVSMILNARGTTELNVFAGAGAIIPTLIEFLALFCAIKLYQLAKDPANEDKLAELAQRAEKRIGFMLVVQICFGFNILVTLTSATLVMSGKYTLGPTEILTYVTLVLDGIAFWLILQRYKMARIWVIATSILNITVGTIIVIATGEFSIPERLGSCSIDIIFLIYFAVAKTPKKVLVKRVTLENQKEQIKNAWELWAPKTWDFWKSMIIYYCLFSIIGHWMEAGYCLLIKHGIMPGKYDPLSGIWRDYLNPFPVYGAGMVACALLLFPVKTWFQDKFKGSKCAMLKTIVASYAFNMVVVAALELILGLTSNIPDANGNYPLWDYSNMPFNFMGQICLLNTLLFAAVASLMSWVVWPSLQTLYRKLPQDVKNISFVGVIVFYALVVCLYVINVPTDLFE